MLNLKKLFHTSMLICLAFYINFAYASNLQFVFIQSAQTAHLTMVDKKSHSYLLTMKMVSPVVHYISDRPQRIAGAILTSQFYKTWNAGTADSFQKDSPNVSLVGIEPIKNHQVKRVILPMVLSNPQYHQNKNEISYQVKLLGSSNVTQVSINNAILFIDSDWCPSCCCG